MSEHATRREQVLAHRVAELEDTCARLRLDLDWVRERYAQLARDFDGQTEKLCADITRLREMVRALGGP